jgi:hypothetical protein
VQRCFAGSCLSVFEGRRSQAHAWQVVDLETTTLAFDVSDTLTTFVSYGFARFAIETPHLEYDELALSSA